jgi:hypothetical protein
MKIQNPNSLKNLITLTPEQLANGRKMGTAAIIRNSELANEFKLTAKAFLKVKEQLPSITALDVIKIAMWQALQNDKFDQAALYAEKIAEYEQPKLQRIEQTTTTRTVDLTEEELLKIIKEEGLDMTSMEDVSDKNNT